MFPGTPAPRAVFISTFFPLLPGGGVGLGRAEMSATVNWEVQGPHSRTRGISWGICSVSKQPLV